MSNVIAERRWPEIETPEVPRDPNDFIGETTVRKVDQTNLKAIMSCGISHEDAMSLRRVERRLHRWHELECGTDRGAIQRDENDPTKLLWYNNYTNEWATYIGKDDETLALKRLASIMKRYPDLTAYVQGDPRGCALYILRPGDVPQGASADSYYTRGVAVF